MGDRDFEDVNALVKQQITMLNNGGELMTGTAQSPPQAPPQPINHARERGDFWAVDKANSFRPSNAGYIPPPTTPPLFSTGFRGAQTQAPRSYYSSTAGAASPGSYNYLNAVGNPADIQHRKVLNALYRAELPELREEGEPVKRERKPVINMEDVFGKEDNVLGIDMRNKTLSIPIPRTFTTSQYQDMEDASTARPMKRIVKAKEELSPQMRQIKEATKMQLTGILVSTAARMCQVFAINWARGKGIPYDIMC